MVQMRKVLCYDATPAERMLLLSGSSSRRQNPEPIVGQTGQWMYYCTSRFCKVLSRHGGKSCLFRNPIELDHLVREDAWKFWVARVAVCTGWALMGTFLLALCFIRLALANRGASRRGETGDYGESGFRQQQVNLWYRWYLYRLDQSAIFSTYRHAAYVSYTYWIYGKLGADIRKVLPSCAVSLIRNVSNPFGLGRLW